MKKFKDSLKGEELQNRFEQIATILKNIYGKDVEIEISKNNLSAKLDGQTILYINRKSQKDWRKNLQKNLERIKDYKKYLKKYPNGKVADIPDIDWDQQGSNDKHYKHGATWTGD